MEVDRHVRCRVLMPAVYRKVEFLPLPLKTGIPPNQELLLHLRNHTTIFRISVDASSTKTATNKHEKMELYKVTLSSDQLSVVSDHASTRFDRTLTCEGDTDTTETGPCLMSIVYTVVPHVYSVLRTHNNDSVALSV